MRQFTTCTAALLLAVVAARPTVAQSSETFICNDGRTIQLTPANRDKLKDDPCVADWFKTQQAQRIAAEKAKAEAPQKKMEGIPSRCRQAWECPELW